MIQSTKSDSFGLAHQSYTGQRPLNDSARLMFGTTNHDKLTTNETTQCTWPSKWVVWIKFNLWCWPQIVVVATQLDWFAWHHKWEPPQLFETPRKRIKVSYMWGITACWCRLCSTCRSIMVFELTCGIVLVIHTLPSTKARAWFPSNSRECGLMQRVLFEMIVSAGSGTLGLA